MRFTTRKTGNQMRIRRVGCGKVNRAFGESRRHSAKIGG